MTAPTGKPRGRPPKDKPPRTQKSGAQKSKERKARDIQLIQSGFTQLLTAPAMAAGFKGDQWAVDHFTTEGPKFAAQIAAECERNDTLRAWCLKALASQSFIMLGFTGFMYAVPALMHYGIVPGAEQMGIPRGKKAAKAPKPAAAPPPFVAPDQPPVPPEPQPEPESEFDIDEGLEIPEEDPLAAELRANGNAPPPPVEAI